MEELGLFPLELVLLPTERLPLHIFEPRYKELIGECVDLEREFVLLLQLDDGGIAEIGTRAAVAQVLQVLPDGRMNVVVEGRGRVRLVELTEGRSFRTGVVEPYEDDDDPAAADDVERALASFERLSAVTASGVEAPTAGSPQLSFELAARIDFGNDLKQELLELRSPRERLERLTELIELATTAVERDKEVEERAAKNGKVAPPRSDP